MATIWYGSFSLGVCNGGGGGYLGAAGLPLNCGSSGPLGRGKGGEGAGGNSDGFGGREGAAGTFANSCAPGGGCSVETVPNFTHTHCLENNSIVVSQYISLLSHSLSVICKCVIDTLCLSYTLAYTNSTLTSLLAFDVLDPPEGETGNLSNVGKPSGNNM